MGTSKGYGGPPTGLVPSWVDMPSPAIAIPSSPSLLPDTQGGNPLSPIVLPTQSIPVTTQPRPDSAGAGTLRTARTNFTRFSKTGSRSSLGRALSDYVQNSTGGARRAARRMGESRKTGARLLQVIRDIQTLGSRETLKSLNLESLAGKPAADVFLGMLEYICQAGGPIDDAIARQAMLETIGELAQAGIVSFDGLTSEQLQQFFLEFVAHSIEGRVIADLGRRSVNAPSDPVAVENLQQQLHDFISGCTISNLSGHLSNLSELSNEDTQRVVDRIYEAAFDLIAAAGDAAA